MWQTLRDINLVKILKIFGRSGKNNFDFFLQIWSLNVFKNLPSFILCLAVYHTFVQYIIIQFP